MGRLSPLRQGHVHHEREAMKQRFVLRPNDDVVLQSVLTALMQRDAAKKYDITMAEHKANRSLAQNSLLWKWHTVYAEEFGETKDRAHEEFKYYHVLPILLRDAEDDGLLMIYNTAKLNPKMMKALVKAISSTLLDTTQFTESLSEYDQRTAARGLCFPHPEDQYAEAMGRDFMSELPEADRFREAG